MITVENGDLTRTQALVSKAITDTATLTAEEVCEMARILECYVAYELADRATEVLAVAQHQADVTDAMTGTCQRD